MPLIDDKGRILGRVNVIDALAVLVLVAVIFAGISLVTASSGATTDTTTDDSGPERLQVSVSLETVVAPYVADAIEPGPIPISSVERISAVETEETVQINTSDGRTVPYDRLTIQASLNATVGSDGLLYFEDERLYIGRNLQLDLGRTIVDATVTDLQR